MDNDIIILRDDERDFINSLKDFLKTNKICYSVRKTENFEDLRLGTLNVEDCKKTVFNIKLGLCGYYFGNSDLKFIATGSLENDVSQNTRGGLESVPLKMKLETANYVLKFSLRVRAFGWSFFDDDNDGLGNYDCLYIEI